MQIPASIRKNRLILSLHIAGLLLYIFSPMFFGAIRPGRFDGVHWPLIANNILIAGYFYLNILLLMPLVLKKRGWLTYIIAGAVSTMLFVTISYFMRELFLNMELLPVPAGLRATQFRPRTFPFFGLFFPYLITWAFSMSVRFSMDYFQLERRRKESENENLKSELSLLRSQISPHFMFNVLNSLTALARKKSDDLEPIIIKLSQLLRYTIYYSAVPRVELETEIEYLENYIDLQKLRFGEHINVRFQKNVTSNDFQIEPMLLISFVENAFKHGSGLVNDPVIEIQIDCREKVLEFNVRNKCAVNSTKDETHGVGLKNVRRRLELLYENHYELKVREEKSWFIVDLTLIAR